MKLNQKQIAYLKRLDSKKKQRKFLLDCLLERVIGESDENDFSDLPINKEEYEIVSFDTDFLSIKTEITSVKRLSDGEIFSIGDLTTKGVISKFSHIAGILSVSVGDQITLLRTFDKVKSPKKDELLQFDKLDKNEVEADFLCEIKDFLGEKLMSLEINEVQELEKIFLKYHKSANSKKKYTEEDLKQAFDCSRVYKAEKAVEFNYHSFAQYLESLKNK